MSVWKPFRSAENVLDRGSVGTSLSARHSNGLIVTTYSTFNDLVKRKKSSNFSFVYYHQATDSIYHDVTCSKSGHVAKF